MNKVVYNTGFGIVPKSVMQDPKLSIEAKGIFCYIATYANSEGMAFPGRDLICYHLGISKNRYTKYMQELKEKGYIEVTQIKEGNKFAHNIYKLIPCPQIRDTQIEDTQIGTLTIPVNNNTSINNKKEKAAPKQTNIDKLISEYTSNKELQETLLDFIKMRKSIKKPLTDRALKMLFTKLDNLSGKDDLLKVKILEQSIFNNWQGIFALKENYSSNSTGKVLQYKKTDIQESNINSEVDNILLDIQNQRENI